MGALRADAQQLGTASQARQVGQQGMDPRGLGLSAGKREKALALAGKQRQAVHDGEAAEFAGVFLQVEMAGGEAAR